MKKSFQPGLITFMFLAMFLSGCAPASTPVTPEFTPLQTETIVSTNPPISQPITTSSAEQVEPTPTQQLIIYPAPGDLSEVEGLGQSKAFSVKVNTQQAFVYEAGQGWSFFSFAFENTDVQVDVTINEHIDQWQVRPDSSGVTPTQTGNTFTFTFSKPEKVILQINGPHGKKLLISAEPPETEIHAMGEPGVLYFGPGIHYLGYRFTPQNNIHTIYLAGGAVVRGTLRIANRPNLKILGRGIFAMGEWPHDEEEGLNLQSNDGLIVDGVTVVDSPGWQLTIAQSYNVSVRNVKLIATKPHYNTDGIEMYHQNNVNVSDFFILANDDAIAIGGGITFVEVKDGILWNNTNGGSIMFDGGGDVDSHDLLFEDIDVLENGSDFNTPVFGTRLGAMDSELISKVTFRNIRVENAVRPNGTQIPIIDMKIGVPYAWLRGSLGRMEDISFENVSFPNGLVRFQGLDPQNGFSHIKFVDCFVGGEPLSSSAQIQLETRFTSDISIVSGSQTESVSVSPFPTAPTPTPELGIRVAAGTELLKSPGFEEGISAWKPSYNGKITIEKQLVRSGISAIMVSGQYPSLWQDIQSMVAAQGKGMYTLSAYIQLKGGSTSDIYYLTVELGDSSGLHWQGCEAAITDARWKYINCTLRIHWTGETNRINLHISPRNGAAGTTFYVDDVSLKKLP